MPAITLHDLQEDPSALINLIEQGQEVTILRNGAEIAKVTPIIRGPRKPFRRGTYDDAPDLPDDFDAPMEIVDVRDSG